MKPVNTIAAALISLSPCAVQAATAVTGDGSLSTTAAPAADSEDELAKKLANPIAAMISIPMQNNFDWGGGPTGDGFQWKLNVQPVIPVSISEDWNFISRTIIPVIVQDDIVGTSSQGGLSDILYSGWLSPKAPTSSGWILGAGPALLFPTGTDNVLTKNQWAAGPTGIALKQDGKFTYGALANQLWSYAGSGGRDPVNSTFIQPFFVYLAGGGWSYALNTESTYDWTGSQWTVPINLMVNTMIKIGNANTQWQLGARYYAEKPDDGPEWGLRFAVTFLIPQS
jgi:hypothetical protein